MNSIGRLIRTLFLAVLFSWIGTSTSIHGLDILIHSPAEKHMAKDIYYGYESVRTYYESLPYAISFYFCIGLIVGVISKPGDLKI